jgi:SAM-dependent methyltransferase
MAIPLPPPDLRFRVAGTDNAEWFEQCGAMTLSSFESALGRIGCRLEDFDSILDFGAGCGRVTRHLCKRLPAAELAACDPDRPAITWMQQALSMVDARVSDPLPPLPFDDHVFDLVISFSVFTHLDEGYQDAWLTELRRVAKPGSLLLLTVHGDWNWQDCLSKLPGLKSMEAEFLKQGFCYTKEDGWAQYFPDYYHTAFHHPDYIRRHWSQWFEVIDVLPQGAQPPQDLVVLRRRCESLQGVDDRFCNINCQAA